jgi:hypothetical protein
VDEIVELVDEDQDVHGHPFCSLPRELFLQAASYPRGGTRSSIFPSNIAEFLDAARAQETVLRAGHQVERVESGACLRLSWFISISYSKSEIRAQPLDDRPRPDPGGELADQDVERRRPDVRDAGRRLVDEAQRSSVENSVLPLRTGWLTIATTTSSNSSAARAMTSRWPFVIGS